MSKFPICFCAPFSRPRRPAELVVFCDSRPFVLQQEVRGYLKGAMDYARAHSVYLVTERFVMQRRLCLCLISPDGKPLGIQKATHLNILYQDVMAADRTISLFDTAFGRLFLCVDVDVFYPEVMRAAALKGADIAICSQFIELYDFNLSRIMSGCWDMAQQNQLMVAAAVNQSACVCMPCPATADESGFVLPLTSSLPANAFVYPHKLHKLREQADVLGAINPDFCARHLPQLDH